MYFALLAIFCVARLNRKLTAIQRLSQITEDEAREGWLDAVVANSKPLDSQSHQTGGKIVVSCYASGFAIEVPGKGPVGRASSRAKWARRPSFGRCTLVPARVKRLSLAEQFATVKAFCQAVQVAFRYA